MKLSDGVKTIAKFGLGIGLIVYVLKSRMVDFDSLQEYVLDPYNLLMGVSFLALGMMTISVRWFLLIRAQGLILTFRKVVQCNFIGYFFNTFMPGAVGGDLIKAWYAAGTVPGGKTRAFFTVLLDRGIGMLTYFIWAAVTLLFYYGELKDNFQLRMLTYSVWAVAGTTIIGTILFFTPWVWKFSIFIKALKFLQRSSILAKIIDAGLAYRDKASAVFWSVILSCFSLVWMIAFFKIQGDLLGIPLAITQYFFIVPVALTVSAIPLLPGGIGVGQVAFFTLFQWMGVPNPELGGTVCTLWQVYTILFNCTGIYFYIRFKHKPSPSQLSSSDDKTPPSRSEKAAFSPVQQT